MLNENRRLQLDDIVKQMVQNKESDDTIQFVVDDFKNKYEGEETQTQPLQQKKSLGAVATDILVGSEKKLGQTFGDALAVQSKDISGAQKSQTALDDLNAKLAKTIIEQKKQGKDTAKLENIYKQNTGERFDLAKIAPSINKSTKQILGEAGGVALDVLSAGTYGAGARGAKAGQLLTKTQIAKNVVKPIYKTAGEAFIRGAIKEAPKGAVLGAGFGATSAMQEDKNISEITKAGVTGGITGGIISGVISGLDAKKKFLMPKKAEELKQKAIVQYQKGLNSGKEKYKEKGEKIIPELLDKKVWGTFRGLMKKADEGIEMAEKDYEKLGELQGIIGTSDIVNKIDDKMSKMLRPDGTVISIKQTSFNELQKLKDDILAYTTKSWIAGESVETLSAEQQKLRELAQNYGKELYDTRKAMKTINDSKTLSQVKEVDGAIRTLLNSKNPKYAEINKIYSLNTSLKDILIDTAQRTNSHKMINIVRAVGGSGGGMLGAVMGGLPGAIAGGITMTAIAEILNSTWYNTLKAVQKNDLANKLLKKSAEELSPTLMLLARQGSKYAEQLLNE